MYLESFEKLQYIGICSNEVRSNGEDHLQVLQDIW